MHRKLTIAAIAASVLALAAGAALAETHDRPTGGHTTTSHAAVSRPPPRAPEAHPGPKGYQRVAEPPGWNARPTTVDRGAYNHNFKAARSYSIGAYHRPAGWVSHRWVYGQILPRAYWASSEYILADYWLFGLEIPPVGYEWVRDDDDALLVNIQTGEILQVEYGVFS